jgi:hypothetical protein
MKTWLKSNYLNERIFVSTLTSQCSVILSTSIWKKSLNCDDQQLHQYQQSEQPPFTTKSPRHMVLKFQALDLDRHKNVVGLNLLMGSQYSASDNWTTNDNTDINK